MRIVEEVYSIKCDMGTCKNPSKYAVEVDDNKRHNIHICSACFEELHKNMMQILKPQSVENVVRRAEKKRDEWKRNK